MKINKTVLLIVFFTLFFSGRFFARTVAISAKATLNFSVLNQWGDSVTNLYTEYGAELNGDLFLSKRFSVGASLGRRYFDVYRVFFTEYGFNLRWWIKMHHWSVGFLYATPVSITASPVETLMGMRFGWGLSGGEGIPWVFEAPVTLGVMDRSRGLYISAGVQAGLLFNL